MDSNEMRIMNIENGSWNIVSTSATPTSEFEQPHRVEQHVERDQQRRVRHHQDRERREEEHVLARELEPRERVPAEQRDARASARTVSSDTNSELKRYTQMPAW